MRRLWIVLRALFAERPRTVAVATTCDQCSGDDYCAPLHVRGRFASVCGDCLQRALQLVERAEARAERRSSDG